MYTKATEHTISLPLVDSLGDALSGAPTITISKDGAAFAAVTNTPTAQGKTWNLVITATEANCDDYMLDITHDDLPMPVFYSDQAGTAVGVNASQIGSQPVELMEESFLDEAGAIAAVTSALNTYDPPTKDELDALQTHGDSTWATADVSGVPDAVVTALGTGSGLTALATSEKQDTILARLGAWTGTGINTLLGAFKALLSKTATAPTDIGGTFDPTTDSVEAIRDTEPMGTAMRGTDGAYTGTPPTVEQIVAGVEAEGGLLDETHTAATETIPTAIGEIEGGGLDAAGVRAALGMAEANLDEQIAGIEATVDEEALATAVASAVGEGIADEVWSNENRTLTGSSSTVGPTSATEVNDIYTTAHKNGTRRLDARVRNWDGDDILQADISSIAYTAYLLDASNPDTRTAIDGHTAVTLDKADVIFDTLQTDEYSSDYNFSHTPPIGTTNLFTTAGRDYLIEYTITPTSGEKIIVRFRVACK